MGESTPLGASGLESIVVDFDALDDAIGAIDLDVRHYLDRHTGAVLTLRRGVTDPSTLEAFASSGRHLQVTPVAPEDQYRWMQRHITTIEDSLLSAQLSTAIWGRKPFRRFNEVLCRHTAEWDAWQAFHRRALRVAVEEWLRSHGLEGRPAPPVVPSDPPHARSLRASRARLRELVDALTPHELDSLADVVDFLDARRRGLNAG